MSDQKRFKSLLIVLISLVILVIILATILIVLITKNDKDTEEKPTKPTAIETAQEINNGLIDAAKKSEDDLKKAYEAEKDLGGFTVDGEEFNFDDEDSYEKINKKVKQVEIESFNAQFTPYAGDNMSATQIRSLKSSVQLSNTVNDHEVELVYSNFETETTAKRYNVELAEYDSEGFITKIVVTVQ